MRARFPMRSLPRRHSIMRLRFRSPCVVVTLLSLFVCAISSFAAADDVPRLDRSNLLQFRDGDGTVRPVRTAAEWQHRRAEVLGSMQRVMGPFPADDRRVPLDVRVEEESAQDGYVRRLITYQSEPGSRTPAYLCIPNDVLAGERRAPAVLCLHPTPPPPPTARSDTKSSSASAAEPADSMPRSWLSAAM